MAIPTVITKVLSLRGAKRPPRSARGRLRNPVGATPSLRALKGRSNLLVLMLILSLTTPNLYAVGTNGPKPMEDLTANRLLNGAIKKRKATKKKSGNGNEGGSGALSLGGGAKNSGSGDGNGDPDSDYSTAVGGLEFGKKGGSGKSAGKSSKKTGARIGYKGDTDPETLSGPSDDHDHDHGGGGGGSGPPAPPSPPQILPYFLPLCFFFDTEYTEEVARKIVKDVVDIYAACDVAVDAHTFTLRPGTYPQHDPDKLNENSRFHCNFKVHYVDNSLYGAGQSFPNSLRASDKMCPEGWEEKVRRVNEGEAEKDVMTTAGCAGMPGDASIVDFMGSGGVSAHEFGHNIGRPGRGGDYLENEGEGNKVRTKAGLGLQLKNSPVNDKEKAVHHDEGTHHAGGFTGPGCASIQGGANDNSVRKIPYIKNALESYYTKATTTEEMIDYNGRNQPALPTGNTPDPVVTERRPPAPPAFVSNNMFGEGSSGTPQSGAGPGGHPGVPASNGKSGGGFSGGVSSPVPPIPIASNGIGGGSNLSGDLPAPPPEGPQSEVAGEAGSQPNSANPPQAKGNRFIYMNDGSTVSGTAADALLGKAGVGGGGLPLAAEGANGEGGKSGGSSAIGGLESSAAGGTRIVANANEGDPSNPDFDKRKKGGKKKKRRRPIMRTTDPSTLYQSAGEAPASTNE